MLYYITYVSNYKLTPTYQDSYKLYHDIWELRNTYFAKLTTTISNSLSIFCIWTDQRIALAFYQ